VRQVLWFPMNPFFTLLVLFFTIPLIEIYLLLQVGGIIGPLATIFLVVFTAVLGAWLLRIQGFATLTRVRETMNQGQIPALEMMEGAILLLSGALLLTPGFFTDAIGFCCLVPALRRALIVWLMNRFMTTVGQGAGTTATKNKGPTTIEGQYNRDDD
jgi:UPF0716 protein FxsA